MEQDTFLPFSSLIASMLLFKERISSTEIINFISLLGQENIFIDDEVDNMDSLAICVDCCDYSCFKIRDDMTYESVLVNGKTVREFLDENANKEIIDFIVNRNYCFGFDYGVLNKNIFNKKKVKVKLLTRIFNFIH